VPYVARQYASAFCHVIDVLTRIYRSGPGVGLAVVGSAVMGAVVGFAVVGSADGATVVVGAVVGDLDGLLLGLLVGDFVGAVVGFADGATVVVAVRSAKSKT